MFNITHLLFANLNLLFKFGAQAIIRLPAQISKANKGTDTLFPWKVVFDRNG